MPQDDSIPNLDFDNVSIKRLVIDRIRGLKGKWYFTLRKCLKDKTPEQLGYLFASVYVDVQSALLEAWGEALTIDEVHEICKSIHWTRPVVDRKSGELKHTLTMSLSEMDVVDMAQYIDKITAWASQYLHCEINPPDPTLSRKFKLAISHHEAATKQAKVEEA